VLTLTKVRVRTFSLDFLEIMWEVQETTEDPHDYQMWVLRSESPAGPWDTLAGPFEDRYRFVDNRVNLMHRWRTLYYKIRVQRKGTTDQVETEPTAQDPEPDLIAAEIQRLERCLWEEYAGRRCLIFPVRTFGQRCPNCWDGPEKGKGFTSQVRRSHCATCYGTGFVRGYLDPIEIFVQIDPSPQSIQTLPITERHQNDTSARLPNFPLVKPRDILVEAENRRWRVARVTPTERLRSVVHQELVLHELSKGDIEFDLPVRWDTQDFEPSPMRNFTVPQNLETFENEALKDVFAIYGYRRS
jgi:hypothetical protein